MVPVGRCSAVLVRCRTSHFERPATPSANGAQSGRPGGRQPEQVGDALRMFGDRALVALPRRERRRHIRFTVEIDRERQRVHHGASAALADVRRQRMGGVADHRHLSGRPAAELDQVEAIVAALVADAFDQRCEMGKPALPGVLAHRRRLGERVAVEHRERDIDVGLAAGRVEHAPAPRPVFDGGGAVGVRAAPPPSWRSAGAYSHRPDICASRAGRARRAAPNCCRRRRRSGRRCSRWPSASTSSPSALAPVATEPVTISAPERVAAAASALMTVWRTMLNTRLPTQRCTEITRLRSSRTSRVWAKGAPFTAAS